MSEMRILTVQQPWAWAIIHGGKDVENRVRNIAGDYRGPVAIHAGLAFDRAGLNDRTLHAKWEEFGGPHAPGNWSDRGAIIGVVDLTDVHAVANAHFHPVCHDHRAPNGLATAAAAGTGACSAWTMPGAQWHLVLTNPRPLAMPIPYKGALGLRRLDKATIDTITAALVAETGEDQ
ncbi:ASCH domain-containing protein [Leucobacter aridicollis]|uniref:ASCH domain-containing protein n=1 Tax=Leucobacter aridicollis TaxID=283878 RepID=UPI0021685862|nr:ASCH domain-containing protein [Leucobacter aridicollis]MCS3426711.1 hypothetical protein [Leucobacter aridicollis]